MPSHPTHNMPPLNSPVECFAPPSSSCRSGHKKPVKGAGKKLPAMLWIRSEKKEKNTKIPDSSNSRQCMSLASPLLVRIVMLLWRFLLVLSRHNSCPRQTKEMLIIRLLTQMAISSIRHVCPSWLPFRRHLSASCRCHLRDSGQRCRRSLGMAFYACRLRRSRG